MKLVVIESPFGNLPDGKRASPEQVAVHQEYLRRAIRDSLNRNEAPYASHGLFPGALDDDNPEERALGMTAGFAWGKEAGRARIYTDYGVTKGMQEGIDLWGRLGFDILRRQIGLNPF